MRITVVGTGYVGLVTAACFADQGHDVVGLDRDAGKVVRLRAGQVPIHEPGLDEVMARGVAAGRLRFTTDEAAAVRHGRLVFLAVGTPQGEDGSADLSHALAAARTVGRHLDGDTVVVNKSTVPVGTTERVRCVIEEELGRRGVDARVDVASNPEFLREGTAVADFLRPDRVVVGTGEARVRRRLRSLYAPCLAAGAKWLAMDVRSAELAKYAANAMLAARVSLMNEFARLAEVLGADIEAVRQGIGADPRIGAAFLQPGIGYGGSCLPKDVKALLHAARSHGARLDVLAAVDAVNERQKRLLVDRVVEAFGEDLSGRCLALWGLAFKPGTDDLREAPSLVVLRELRRRGATVVTCDPVAMPAARRLLGDDDGLAWASSPLAACDGADALLIATEWPQFRRVDPAAVARRLRTPLVLDGRNLFDPGAAQAAGLDHRGIGRGGPPSSRATAAVEKALAADITRTMARALHPVDRSPSDRRTARPRRGPTAPRTAGPPSRPTRLTDVTLGVGPPT